MRLIINARRFVAASLLTGIFGCTGVPGFIVDGDPVPAPGETNAARLARAYDNDIGMIRQIARNADYAMLAWLAYDDAAKDGALLPKNWSAVQAWEEEFSGSGGIAAELFSGPNEEYVLAFRGTDQWEDWVIDNTSSVFQFPTPMLQRARTLAREISGQHRNVKFVGHSLGGRLAIVASMATGNRAVVFDSAFTSITDSVIGGILWQNSRAKFTAFSSPWDPVAGLTPLKGIVIKNYPENKHPPNFADPAHDQLRKAVIFFHDPGLLAISMKEIKENLAAIERAI